MKHASTRLKHAPTRRAVLAAALPLMGASVGELVELPRMELLDAEPLLPAHWKDRAAVLVFFHTSCPFCARHNQLVEKLHRSAEGRRLQVLGMNLGEAPAVVRDYRQQRGLSFPISLAGVSLRPRFSARSVIPLTAGMDRRGRWGEVMAGEMFGEDVMGLLRHAG